LRFIPWITLVLAAVLALNPVGLEFLHGAFVSTEALTQKISGPIVWSVIALLLLIAIAEMIVRYFRARIRGRTGKRV